MVVELYKFIVDQSVNSQTNLEDKLQFLLALMEEYRYSDFASLSPDVIDDLFWKVIYKNSHY